MNWPIKRVIAGFAVIILAGLYFSGNLDNLLYKVGLNYHQCGENGFGAVFCGNALTQYDHRITALDRQLQQIPTIPNITTTPATSVSSAATSTTAVTSSGSSSAATAAITNVGPGAASVVAAGPGAGSGTGSCPNGVGIGANTSCSFAENVYRNVGNADVVAGYVPRKITAYSPVTRKHYTLTCYIDNVPEVVCSTSGGATVSIPYNPQS